MPKSVKKRPKTRSAARFGARYGTRVRKQVAAIESVSKANHECPKCHDKKLVKLAMGIWGCKKCGFKKAGGAWRP
jgi:large subunit ribosomal protein L37Ae